MNQYKEILESQIKALLERKGVKIIRILTLYERGIDLDPKLKCGIDCHVCSEIEDLYHLSERSIEGSSQPIQKLVSFGLHRTIGILLVEVEESNRITNGEINGLYP